ncbi:MAG: hypothetical protein N2491_04620 [Negativicutes bacterium]|nr:hypothetical protein [Negativicutes bacterium]
MKKQVSDLLKRSEILLGLGRKKLASADLDDLADIIDSIVDSFVAISNILETQNLEFMASVDEISEILVELIEAFKLDRNKVSGLYTKLYYRFAHFRLSIYQYLAYTIAILGETKYLPVLVKHLNNGKNSLILVSDEHHSYKDNYGLTIIPIEKLQETDYDFFMICSNKPNIEQELGNSKFKNLINLNKTLDDYFQSYRALFYKNYQYNLLNCNIAKAKSNSGYELFIAGLSYALMGVHEGLLQKKSVKLSSVSQDLYYDLLIAKKILSGLHSFRYCILGLAYYSFDFDLSLSGEAWRIQNTYYPIFGDAHHYQLPANYCLPVGVDKIAEIIEISHPVIYHDMLLHCLEATGQLNCLTSLDEKQWNNLRGNMSFEELGRQRALRHSQFSYDKTRIEYKKIFREYLDLLKKNNIIPILVVFPTCQYYYENFGETQRKRFYEIINEFKNEYKFQIYDFFSSPLFSLEDFSDSDHLNTQGAIKMTQFLNEIIGRFS